MQRRATRLARARIVRVPDSCSCAIYSLPRQKQSKDDPTETSRKRKVRMIHFSHFNAVEPSETEVAEKEKNTGPAKKRETRLDNSLVPLVKRG